MELQELGMLFSIEFFDYGGTIVSKPNIRSIRGMSILRLLLDEHR